MPKVEATVRVPATADDIAGLISREGVVIPKDQLEDLLARPETLTWAAQSLQSERVLAVFGTMELEPGVAFAFSFLNAEATAREMAWVRAKAKEILPTLGFVRVEAAIRPDWKPGHVWLTGLGFEPQDMTEDYLDSEGNPQLRYTVSFPPPEVP